MTIATQALLRDAMRRLNMTRDAFAENWLSAQDA